MKKLISIFLCMAIMLCFLGTNIQGVLAEGDVFNIQDEVTGNTLSITINAPSKMYKSVLYIDGVKICSIPEIASGSSVTHNADISNILAGRHVASFLANSEKGIISEEKTFTITKSGVPGFTNAAFIADGSEVSESNWENGKPEPTYEGYKFTLSGAVSGDVKLYYFENGKKNLLDAEITKSNNEYTIKTQRTPFGNTMYIAQFGNELQYAFKTVASEDVTVYKNLDFEKELGVTYYSSTVNSETGEVIERKTVDNNGVLHAAISSSSDGFFAQADAETIVNEDNYVVDFKINISKLDSSASIVLLEGTDANGDVRRGFNISSSGKITQAGTWFSSLSYTLSKNKWYRIVTVYKLNSSKYDFYVYDGNSLVYNKNNQSIEGALRPTFFKIDLANGGAIDFMMDDFRVYSGTAKNDNLPVELHNMSSIMEKATDAEKIIGTASVFTTDSDNYYFANQKYKYPSSMAKPVEVNGAYYVSAEFVSDVLLANDSADANQIKVGSNVFSSGSDGVINIDGKLFLRADKVALALGKKYTSDDRGYFVFSDSNFSATNSSEFVNILDDSDIFYRYVMMENPHGEEILSDFKNGGLYGVHPRILMTAEEALWLKNLAQNGDAEVQNEIAIIKSRAENHLNWAGITAGDSDSAKQNTASAAQNVITYHAQAYLLTGDARYAEAGIKILDAASGWTNLAWSTSNLTTGHWAALMAIGYDSFYNYLSGSESGRAKLQTYRNAIEKLAFDDTVLAYSGNGPRWVTIADNFSGVIGGGMLALCMAVADESQFKNHIPYLLENIIKTNELSAALYYNDGAYFEGTTYSEYMLTNLSIGLESLFKACNGDYGIGNSRGFKKAGDMFAYLNTATQTFDFSDSEPQSTNSFVPVWFGYRYGEVGSAELNMKRMREDDVDNKFLQTIFFYKKMVEKYGEADVSDMPLDKYFSKTLTGSFRNSFDEKYPIAAFFHLAKNGTTHDHLDVGQWEFESNGVKWAMDLGPDDYNLPNYFSSEGYKIYRKHPQGHNLVLINPKKDSGNYMGQSLTGGATLLSYESTKNEASALFDLTDAYSRDAKSYTRGYYLGDNRTTFTVEDKLTFSRSGSEIYWFMHTEADIKISDDKKSAILTKDGQILKVEIDCSSSSYEVYDMAAAPLDGTPSVSGQATETVRKLAIRIPSASTSETISVKLIPPGSEFNIVSPADKAVYFNKDVEISVISPACVPTVKFDGTPVTLDGSKAPVYTATVPFADKALGMHDVAIEADGKEYKRTIELCANIGPTRYTYKFLPSEGQKICIYQGEGNYYDGRTMNQGTLTQIPGTDGKTDDAFKMTKTGGDAYFQFIGEYTNAQHPQANSVYSVAFDVKRANDGSVFDMEGKSKGGVYAWLGRPESFIGADGKIDNSNVVLPAGEWHNIELVFEAKNQGTYWVYLDGELIHTQATSYDYSSIYLMKFQMKSGGMDFDNLSYGKYIVNPRLESIGYVTGGKEFVAPDNKVSTGAEKIVLNLTTAYDQVGSVKVNGVSATAEVIDKKLIITPSAILPANEVINIEVSAGSKVSGETLSKSVIYKVETSGAVFSIASPADNAVYYDKDIVVSVISPTDVPVVTFDGTQITMDNSNFPEYTATIPSADKYVGLHDIIIKADGKEYKRTVEICANIATGRYTYKFLPSEGQKVCIYQGEGNYYDGRTMNQGTLTQIPGTDGKTDDAFKMTKTGGDAYFQFIGEYTNAQHPQANSVYSVAFDVKRANDGSVFDMEGKSNGGYTWLGKAESFIGSDGKIDNSDVVLPAGEWHNIEFVFEAKNQGTYWVYLDGELIHTQATSYDYSSIYLMKFQMKSGAMDFDNLSYGKYIANPRLESVSYTANGVETAAKDGVISPVASSITLNLTDSFGDINVSTANVKINGAAVASAVVNDKKLVVTPATALAEDSAIYIEVSAGKLIRYRVYTGTLKGKLISFKLEEGNNSDVYVVFDYSGGYAPDIENVMVFIGAYDGNRLIDGIAEYHPVSLGENKITSNSFVVPDGTTVKAFVWGEDMTPIAMEVR